jgi:transposase
MSASETQYASMASALRLYLDQNYLSGIAKGKPAFRDLEPVLRKAVDWGAVDVVESVVHEQESLPRPDLQLLELLRGLSGGQHVPDQIERWLRRSGADHRYISLLMSAPGIGWVTGFTIASEIGDIKRFSSPFKLTGYTGLCPRVSQSGEMDRRGPLSKHGPKYLRWGLMEAAIAASSHPLYKERYQRTKRRLGRQRGAKVAQIELARKLTEAIWYMLTRNEPFKPFAPASAISRLTA